jgi:23S rRNA pseudouridine1911/1915/1917 synthase
MVGAETVRRFVVEQPDRLDRAIVEAMPELSRSQVRRLIESGDVLVDGRVVEKASTAVLPGASVEVVPPVVPDLDLLAHQVPLEIIYEDEETLVLNKQPGLVVHPRPGMNAVTLINAVRARYPEVREIDGSDRGGIVHRLDRDTSGVIALAKTEASQHALKEQWRTRQTVKVYLALVEGRVDPPEGIVDAQLGVDPIEPSRRAVVERGQSAVTQYAVLEQYGDEAALLEVRIFTGRTHQIRVHMEAVGHPILGDFMYGRESGLIERQALHAWRLGFTLASNGAWREFAAPLPDDMTGAIRVLRERHGVKPSKAAQEAGAA